MSPFTQQQFLTVLDRDDAERRFHHHLDLSSLSAEVIPLADALGRVLAVDFRAPVDVPAFDRSNVDGFAVRAEDTFGAAEDTPVSLTVAGDTLTPGRMPTVSVASGAAVAVATGAVLPRGATAVVMVEHTDFRDGQLLLNRPAVPGANVTWAGTDIGRGETVLLRGTVLTSRETGVLAALGVAEVAVVRKPRVGIISTGDELQPPGEPPKPGCVFDSNQTVIADAVRELGGEAVRFGIVPDDLEKLRETFADALRTCDVVLLSGGTSKGTGDVSYRVVDEFGPPGIVAHGVALKPGKPLCLGICRNPSPLGERGSGEGESGSVTGGSETGLDSHESPSPLTPASLPQGRGGPARTQPLTPRGEGSRQKPIPVAVLPGFPTSAVFTFHEFLAPVIRRLAGRPPDPAAVTTATISQRLNSERGRTEFVLVGLADGNAIPLGKGSGSVTAFGRADGFVTIPRHREYLEAGETVSVTLIGTGSRPADVVVVGSHCLGLDVILGALRDRGFSAKVFSVGSTAGLEAVKRGECDLAGIHLLDPTTNEYNRPFLTPGLTLIPGYARRQGIVFRPDDARFLGKSLAEVLASAVSDPACVLANRNRGSGTRIVLDLLLKGAKPAGYLSEAKSHSAVVAAVAQGRADWGLAIEPAAREYALGFLPVRDERYDFVTPTERLSKPAVAAFVEALSSTEMAAQLRELGFGGG